MASTSNKYPVIMLLCLIVTAAYNTSVSFADTITATCPEVWIKAERLPDMNLPRYGHYTFITNGELTVFGGHTSGFIPTPTAEYYKDGAWHLMSMVYPHDNGIAVPLSSGKVLIAGGHEKNLGIGQTFVAEMYDPTNHDFDGFGCLDRARCVASGAELDSGRIIIAGNHYAKDDIEYFDGDRTFSHVKEVCSQRCMPYILRISSDDAIIFGATDDKDRVCYSSHADRFRGEPFDIPLLETWAPLRCINGNPSLVSLIGDTLSGDYSYLIPALDQKGKLGIIKVSGTNFSLLSTLCPVPTESRWGKINYISIIIVDRLEQKGYLYGLDETSRHYLLCIAYGDMQAPAQLTLYYTDPLEDSGYSQPIITDEGNIIVAGGITDSNFSPFKSVYLFPVGRQVPKPDVHEASLSQYLLWITVLLLLALLATYLWQKHQKNESSNTTVATEEISDSSSEELMQRICQMMEDKKPYLNSELKISDIASQLDTSTRQISESIRANRGCSFAQFVNTYRIEYAKQLLKQPGVKIISVCMESGFSNETSFFRTFKTFTGMTPKEWISHK